MKNIRITVLCLGILFFSSCVSPTKITSSWQDPGKQVNLSQLNKVLVVGMFKSVAGRHEAENQMVKYLGKTGVLSYNYLDDNFNRKDEVGIREKIKADGFDGAITMRLVDVDKEQGYSPGNISITSYYPTFSEYYYKNFSTYSSPGYFYTTKTFTVEINVYSIKENKIIWTAVTKTVNPGGVEKLTKSVAKMAYNKMVDDGFIRK